MTEAAMDSAENNDGSLSDVSGSAESLASASSTLSPGTSGSHRTAPTCNKCKNHDRTELLKGHKRYCPYRDCTCQPCLLTVEKRKVMAAQTRQKRAQIQDERAGVPIEHRAPVLPPRENLETMDWNYNSPVSDLPGSPPLEPPSVPSSKRKYEDILESQKQASMKLIQDFGVANTALPFALVVFRNAGNFKTATKIILDAQNEILRKSLQTASMVYERPSIFSHGPNYMPEAHFYSVPFTPYRPFANGGGAIPAVHDSSRRPRAPTPRN